MRWLVALALVGLAACGGTNYLSREELMDPTTCMQCHADHYTQWSGSMHAYASNDPVFLAMNARGQAATNGALGDFCVRCHAPMARRLGLTTDGLNLATDAVPQYAKGVTCYFCHTVDDVTADHTDATTDPMVLADDDTLRGPIANPVDEPAHRAAQGAFQDGHTNQSAQMCGACHDLVTPAGVPLERTFSEWKGTIFGQDNPRTHLTCAQCHMFATDGVITSGPGAVGLDVPLRPLGVHEHTFGGIDKALTDWPEKDAQTAAIDRDLGPAIGPKLCISPANGGQIEVTLDDRGPGHRWPSGASQDRRAWVELIAYDTSNNVVFSSGIVPDAMDPEQIGDANLWAMNDKVTDANGQPAHFFWDVRTVDSTATLPPAVTTDISDPRYYHAVTHVYPTPGQVANFAKVDMRVLIRPMPHAMLNDLISGGELDPTAAAAMPTIELAGTKLEWTAALGTTTCAM